MKSGAREAKSVFVIELTYKAELAAIDAAMAPHMAYLKKYYDAGVFVLSGRKIPREGGVILAVGETRERVEAIAREDPFHARGLSDFRVIEFRASQRADDLAQRLG
ncbi:MAG TPA: YciI family protein [Polyangiaceae bacterium]